MANKRFEQIGIQPFRTRPLLAEGLLAVSREGGDLERRVAQGLFNLSAQVGNYAAAKAEKQNLLAGPQDALKGRVRSTIVQDDGIPAVAADGKPVKPKPAGQTAAYARDRFMKVHGLPAHVAAAMAGHGQAESGFDPNAVGDNGTAIGFYQWRGNRASNLKAFAKARGKHWKDTDTQLDFAVHELKSSEGLAWRQLQKARNVDEATAAFMHFERPQGWTIANPRGGHNFSGRLAYAQGLLGANAPQPGTPDDVPLPPPVAGAAPDDDGITLSGGTWRPTGRDTVGGRAYDKAGIQTYMNTLEAEMTRTTGQIFRKFRNDPGKMAEAFDSLQREFMGNHVFPEIAVDFEVAYLGKVNSYLNAADAEAADRAMEADRANFNTRTQELEAGQQQAIAGMDPKNPAVADEIARQQQGIDAHYDEAVTRGLMKADDAAEAKIASRRTAALGFYEKQAESLDADGIKTMRETMEADFADGGIDGLDGKGWLALSQNLIASEKGRRSEDARIVTEIRNRGETFASRVAAGYEIDKAEWSQYRLDASAAGPLAQAIAAETEAKINTARAVRDMTLPEAEAQLKTMRAAMGNNPSDAQLRIHEFADKAHEDRLKAVGDNPYAYADMQGMPVKPIDTSTPDALNASLNERRQQAQEISQKLGIPVPLYQPGEVKEIKGTIGSADPKRHADAMAQIEFLASETGLKDVEDTFGDKAVTALLDWQARVRYLTPDEAKDWLKQRNDPQWQKRVEPLISKGESEARKLSFDDVAELMDENWVWSAQAPVDGDTKRMMMNDFAVLTGERHAVTEDLGEAKEQAALLMKKRWGVTMVNADSRGGRLMAYPPEELYPAIAGGHVWLGEQFADVAAELGASVDGLSLVADGRTTAASDKGELPGYLLSRVDPETGLSELVSDDQGRVRRFYFDPDAARLKAQGRAEEARRVQNDPWLVLSEGTSVDPFYPPWRPATKADMAQRKQRIRDILDARQKARNAEPDPPQPDVNAGGAL